MTQCSRSGKEIPGSLFVRDTPQFIVLTFDDPINDATYPHAQFLERYTNPNGCPIQVRHSRRGVSSPLLRMRPSLCRMNGRRTIWWRGCTMTVMSSRPTRSRLF